MIEVPLVKATITFDNIPIDLLLLLLEATQMDIIRRVRIHSYAADIGPWTMSHGPNNWPILPSDCGNIDWMTIK